MTAKKVTPVNHDTIVLKKIYHYKLTRFCVDSNGQKTYYDNNMRIPYSSGQQQKHSLIEEFLKLAEQEHAPSELFYEYDNSKDAKLNHKIFRITTDLRHLESYLRGHMYNVEEEKASKSKSKKKTAESETSEAPESEENGTQKLIYIRPSAFKISCLSPVHPKLSSTVQEAHVMVDRRGKQKCDIIITDSKTKEVFDDEKTKYMLENTNFNGAMHFKPSEANQNFLVSGVFEVTMEVDLKQLFKTRLSKYERTLPESVKNDLLSHGWYITKEKNIEYINPPDEFKEFILDHLPEAIFNFTSKTNQNRNYAVPELLAIAMTNDASEMPRIFTVDVNEDNKYFLTFNANDASITDHTTLFIDTIVAKNHGVLIDGDKFENLFPKTNAIETIKQYLISKF